jgi:hypothetical protein
LYEGQFIMALTTFSGPVVSQNGFILPVLTTTQVNAIVNPQTGLMVFNSTTNAVTYYDGSAWV